MNIYTHSSIADFKIYSENVYVYAFDSVSGGVRQRLDIGNAEVFFLMRDVETYHMDMLAASGGSVIILQRKFGLMLPRIAKAR